jgi:hypothetical protein
LQLPWVLAAHTVFQIVLRVPTEAILFLQVLQPQLAAGVAALLRVLEVLIMDSLVARAGAPNRAPLKVLAAPAHLVKETLAATVLLVLALVVAAVVLVRQDRQEPLFLALPTPVLVAAQDWIGSPLEPSTPEAVVGARSTKEIPAPLAGLVVLVAAELAEPILLPRLPMAPQTQVVVVVVVKTGMAVLEVPGW